MLKVCIVASVAYYGTQSLTAPDGRSIKENVVVLHKCKTRPKPMVSIFYDQTHKRLKRFREWSKQG